jgi:branched-chain amino acid transport system substrate-binding protein
MTRKSLFFMACLMVIVPTLFPAAIHAAESVKIAAIFAKTGQAVIVPSLRPEFCAIRLAVKGLNADGGLLGHPVEVLELDNQSTALGARQAAEKAVLAKVIAVIGATRSSHSLGMAPVLQAAGIPMISPVSTSPQVTLVGDYIFRVCFIDDFQGEVMAAFAIKDLKAKTAVVLTNTGEKFSLSLAKVFMEKFRKLGGKILWEGDYLGTATDFETQLIKTKALQPDVCFVPGYDNDSGFIIKQSRQLGISSIFLSGDGLTDAIYKYAGNSVEGTYYSSYWHPADANSKSRQFVQTYEKEYGKIIEAVPALTYDAVMLLADAVKRARSIEPAKIKDALAETKAFKGITGEITFDENRNPINKPAVIQKFENGATLYVKTIQP